MANRSEAHEEILKNINTYIYGCVDGFYSKYFGSFDENDAASKTGRRMLAPSTPASATDFPQWFASLFPNGLVGSRGAWHTQAFQDSDSNVSSGAHVFLTLDDSAEKQWHDVQVVGQYRHDHTQYEVGFLDLCKHAGDVFASQLTRFFLHGFYIRGSLMELWVFDRSGVYSCDVFDIQKDFARFLTILDSYRLMSDEELGMSTIIKNDAAGKYVATTSGQLYLEAQPLVSCKMLVHDGTFVYRAKKEHSSGWDCVVKFKWRGASAGKEEQMLRITMDKKVWGMASLEYEKIVVSTAELRSGLQFGVFRQFPSEKQQADRQDIKVQGGITGILDYTEETNSYYKRTDNRVLCCIAVSPVGRPLWTFKSPLELLEVLRDAAGGLRSLYQDAGIVHNDVSIHNIIIVDSQTDGEPKGILIDLDNAEEWHKVPDEVVSVVGNLPFMAIGVLERKKHTYRHDLESLLYVFLWIVVSNGTNYPPDTSKMQAWNSRKTGWAGIAELKIHDMDEANFGSLLAEFPTEFEFVKPLAKSLHHLMFPLQNGAQWTGTVDTPEGTDELYGGIISAFNEAIHDAAAAA